MITRTLDSEADAMYVRVADAPVDRTVEVSASVYVDLAADDEAVGIEVLGVNAGAPLAQRVDIASALERFNLGEDVRRALLDAEGAAH